MKEEMERTDGIVIARIEWSEKFGWLALSQPIAEYETIVVRERVRPRAGGADKAKGVAGEGTKPAPKASPPAGRAGEASGGGDSVTPPFDTTAVRPPSARGTPTSGAFQRAEQGNRQRAPFHWAILTATLDATETAATPKAVLPAGLLELLEVPVEPRPRRFDLG